MRNLTYGCNDLFVRFFGGGGGGPPPKVPAPTPIATKVSPEVQRKTEDERRRLLSGRGRGGTILAGLDEKRTVLG